jgi:hypothetical protein
LGDLGQRTQADALAGRLMRIPTTKAFCSRSRCTRTALRLTLLEIANRLERYALLFEVGDKKPDSEPGQFEHDPGNRIPATTPRPGDLFRALEPTSARPRRRCHERDEGLLRSGPGSTWSSTHATTHFALKRILSLEAFGLARARGHSEYG